MSLKFFGYRLPVSKLRRICNSHIFSETLQFSVFLNHELALAITLHIHSFAEDTRRKRRCENSFIFHVISLNISPLPPLIYYHNFLELTNQTFTNFLQNLAMVELGVLRIVRGKKEKESEDGYSQ